MMMICIILGIGLFFGVNYLTKGLDKAVRNLKIDSENSKVDSGFWSPSNKDADKFKFMF